MKIDYVHQSMLFGSLRTLSESAGVCGNGGARPKHAALLATDIYERLAASTQIDS